MEMKVRARLRAGHIVRVLPAFPWLLILLALLPANAQKILVLRASGPDFKEALNGLEEGLGSEFRVQDLIQSTDFSVERMKSILVQEKPEMVVLMDNPAIRIYAELQSAWTDTSSFPPSVSLMALRVDKSIRGIRKATGIFYEVPAVTTLVNLRALLRDPLRKVGVLYRPSMREFVQTNSRYCLSENIQLIEYMLGERPYGVVREIKAGLKHLIKREKVDAIWVLNDNFYLSPEIIEKAWLPSLVRFKKPIVVGVENLVSPKVPFGAFAVLPDHYGLGMQAAEIILRYREGRWEFAEGFVQQPLAVYKILNVKRAKMHFNVKDERLKEIDKLVQ